MESRFMSIFTFAVAGGLLVSCSLSRLDENTNEGNPIVFVSRFSDGGDTRTTVINMGNNVWWSPQERISVFSQAESSSYAHSLFASTNTSQTRIADFEGSLPIVIGTQEAEQTAPSYWAVYPYDATNSCDGESVTLTVRSNQPARTDSFADNVFPAIATSNDFSLSFYNVCGGIRFSVTRQGIDSVTFRSLDGEPLAGRVVVGFSSEGVPEVRQVLEGVDAVTVYTNDARWGLEMDTYLYATLLPQQLSKGLSVTLHKGSTTASFTIDKELQINRSRFGILDNLDKGLVFE